MTVQAVPRERKHAAESYASILKSTLMMGGASVVTIICSIIRNKAIALILGPEGIGLMGLYGSIVELAQTVAGMGVQASGVRQIAAANASGDASRVARTATAVRMASLVLGLIGWLMLVVLAAPLSRLSFGTDGYATGVALLGAAVFLRLVSNGQIGLIHGMRQIGDLARINVLAAVFSTIVSIPLVLQFGNQGIVPALVLMAAATVATSWWYSRRITLPKASVSISEVTILLRLGLAFMASGLLTIGAGYAVRVIVLHEGGVAAAGLYQAAWALGGLYASFILQAMGTDFYPRLTAVGADDEACNRLVNEQSHISLLLAGPGLLATLTFAPIALALLYTPEFSAAVDLLRWLCLGMMLRIVAWPMGFVLLARSTTRIFVVTEIAATTVHVGLAWILVRSIGITGAGIAFFGLYVWHTALIYLIVRRMTGFRWSAMNMTLGLLFVLASGLVFAAFNWLPLWAAIVIGSVSVVASGIHSLRALVNLLAPESRPAWLRPFERFIVVRPPTDDQPAGE
jgi:antigen flippase